MKGVRYVTQPVRCLTLLTDQVEPHHKEASKQSVAKDGRDVQSLCSTLGTNTSNPFMVADDSDQLWNIDTGMVFPEEAAKDLLEVRLSGEKLFNQFV